MSTDFSSETEQRDLKAVDFSADEERIGKDLYAAIQHASNYSARAQQARKFRVGVSDIGFCSERTRRMLDQQVPEDTDALTAWIGTALGDYAEQAAMTVWPNAIRQGSVRVELRGEERIYVVEGHPDLVVPEEALVIDVKTDYGLGTVERSGPNQQQQFQRHCYAKGAWEAGMFGDVALEDVRVANVWIDRAGIDKRLHVQMEQFNPDYVRGAAEWLDEVVYAHLHEEEARKEPPREMCAVVCGFFGVCRAYDTDVEGLIREPETVAAAKMYREGLDMERSAKRLKDQARQHLVGVRGSTGEFAIRWTHVNESEIPARTRSAYEKLEVKPLPKPKGSKS